jgi:hypothetical protein
VAAAEDAAGVAVFCGSDCPKNEMIEGCPFFIVLLLAFYLTTIKKRYEKIKKRL